MENFLIGMTRKIDIGGIIFHVEPVGYEILKAYQAAWNQVNPKAKTLWEEQTAEYLLQQLSGGNTVTTAAHVEGMNSVLMDIPFKPSRRKVGNQWKRFISQVAFGLW